MKLPALSTSEAAVFETFVVPRYLSGFGAMALDALVFGERSALLHLGCRTGYPDAELTARLAGGSLLGVDASPSSIELARAKAQLLKGAYVEYAVCEAIPTSFAEGAFSHVLSLHPSLPGQAERAAFFAEVSRLLLSGGQAVVVLPLRGSFVELIDLLREYALKHDAADLGRAAEASAQQRPTIEALSEEIEAAGFEDVDIELSRTSIVFSQARELFEDPAIRLLVLPELKASLGGGELDAPLRYVREAIEKYWSEGSFELSLTMGCVSARKC